MLLKCDAIDSGVLAGLSDAALAMWLRARLWDEGHGRGGWIPGGALWRFSRARNRRSVAVELVVAGVWAEEPGGYRCLVSGRHDHSPFAIKAPERALGTTWVYFIQRGADGPIKIGWASDPAGRLSDLQVGSPDRLALIGVRRGGQKEERAIHRDLGQYRVRGEWFSPAPAVIQAARQNEATNGLV